MDERLLLHLATADISVAPAWKFNVLPRKSLASAFRAMTIRPMHHVSRAARSHKENLREYQECAWNSWACWLEDRTILARQK